MKIGDLVELLDAQVLTSGMEKDREVDHAFTSDLMSDVLTGDYQKTVLVTGLSNLQAIRTAEMSDIQDVIIGRGKEVSRELVDLAEDNGISLMKCSYSLFRISGLLYKAGLTPLY